MQSDMGLNEQGLLDAADSLARSVGLPGLKALVLLVGGKNNRVFKAQLEDGCSLVLKSYFSDPRDTRDRLGAEWSFINYSWQKGVRNIPEPIAKNEDLKLGLYSHLRGAKLPTDGVEERHVQAAIDFILEVNAAPRMSEQLAPGSEACFSLGAHIATVGRRVEALKQISSDHPYAQQAQNLVADRLLPVWEAVEQRLTERAGQLGFKLDEALSAEEVIVSPSDFGFHNALVQDDAVSFIDFEYAGRDDLGKFICDFFCQPEIPVPVRFFDGVLEQLVESLGVSERQGLRCAALLDVYRVKWTCIMLNPFLPVGAARRAFAAPEQMQSLYTTQLSKAEAALSAIDSSF